MLIANSDALRIREPELSWLNDLAKAAEFCARAMEADCAAILVPSFMETRSVGAVGSQSILFARKCAVY
jgi:hypothetical protein